MSNARVTNVEHDMRVRKVSRAVTKVASRNGNNSPTVTAVAKAMGMNNSGNLHALLGTGGRDAGAELDLAWKRAGFQRSHLEDYPGISGKHSAGRPPTTVEVRRTPSPSVTDQSETAWKRVDALLEAGSTNTELANLMGYAHAASFQAAHRDRKRLPTAKRDAVAEAYRSMQMVKSAAIPTSPAVVSPNGAGGDAWDAVLTAGQLLLEALDEVETTIPPALLNDRFSDWRDTAEQINNFLGAGGD